MSQRVRIADWCQKTCTEVHVVVTFKQGNSSNNLSLHQLHAQ